MKACKTKFKQPQKGVKLSSKPTPRRKTNRTMKNLRREKYLQR